MTTDWAGLLASLLKADPDAQRLIDQIEEVSIEMLVREKRSNLPPMDDAAEAVLRRSLGRPFDP